MSWCLRIPEALLRAIRADLSRPHAFAAERVGFVEAALGNKDAEEKLILASAYVPVPDAEYIDDPTVGARIGGALIRRAVERALTGRTSVFHIHAHEHGGRPRFSGIDLTEIPPIVRSLRVVGRTQPHGALLLSRDAAAAMVWLPGSDAPNISGRITIVGRPMRFLENASDHGRV